MSASVCKLLKSIFSVKIIVYSLDYLYSLT